MYLKLYARDSWSSRVMLKKKGSKDPLCPSLDRKKLRANKCRFGTSIMCIIIFLYYLPHATDILIKFLQHSTQRWCNSIESLLHLSGMALWGCGVRVCECVDYLQDDILAEHIASSQGGRRLCKCVHKIKMFTFVMSLDVWCLPAAYALHKHLPLSSSSS